jgi:hypothetical protein
MVVSLAEALDITLVELAAAAEASQVDVPAQAAVEGGRAARAGLELFRYCADGSPQERENPHNHADSPDGRYWARTSDLRLVEAALSQLS